MLTAATRGFIGKFPGGAFALVPEAGRKGNVEREERSARKVLAVEWVLASRGEKLVLLAATCEIDVRLGAAGSLVDVGGGEVIGRALDRVGRDGVSMIEAGVVASLGVGVLIEEGARNRDTAGALKVHDEQIP